MYKRDPCEVYAFQRPKSCSACSFLFHVDIIFALIMNQQEPQERSSLVHTRTIAALATGVILGAICSNSILGTTATSVAMYGAENSLEHNEQQLEEVNVKKMEPSTVHSIGDDEALWYYDEGEGEDAEVTSNITSWDAIGEFGEDGVETGRVTWASSSHWEEEESTEKDAGEPFFAGGQTIDPDASANMGFQSQSESQETVDRRAEYDGEEVENGELVESFLYREGFYFKEGSERAEDSPRVITYRGETAEYGLSQKYDDLGQDFDGEPSFDPRDIGAGEELKLAAMIETQEVLMTVPPEEFESGEDKEEFARALYDSILANFIQASESEPNYEQKDPVKFSGYEEYQKSRLFDDVYEDSLLHTPEQLDDYFEF